MRKVIVFGQVPEQWKIAKVIPIHKKGSTKNITNYRPISNLSVISKIFEKLLLSRVAHIEVNENCDLTGSAQHGFKKNRSTETACLEIQSRIAQGCDTGKFATMSSLDLSAAFDVVDHALLVKRMTIMGLPGQLIRVIADWLNERSFYCDINGSTSVMKRIYCGTVQGSILGPLLFAIFISPLEDIIAGLVTFADDNYQITIGVTEAESLAGCVIESEKMICWMNNSGLCVNTSKTEICTFNRRDVRISQVVLNGVTLVVNNQIRVLGLIFDTKLCWDLQVGKAIASANKAKQAIKLISVYFTSDELSMLATAYFYSKLYYGARVWLIKSLSARLTLLLWQNSSCMLKIVAKDYCGAFSFLDLHRKYRRATPLMWSNYSNTCAMFNVVCHNTPNYVVPSTILNVLHSTRQLSYTFTRSNQTKIGFNCLSNRFQLVSTRLKQDWSKMSFNTFKICCKREFINEPLDRLV